jgi:hypothetical protein
MSVGKINNAKNIFLIATLSKKAGKNLFDFGGLLNGRQRGILEKLVLH